MAFLIRRGRYIKVKGGSDYSKYMVATSLILKGEVVLHIAVLTLQYNWGVVNVVGLLIERTYYHYPVAFKQGLHS